MDAISRDALLGRSISYKQLVRGYRVTLEAPLLARFALRNRTRPFSHAVDLGAGPGAIGLMLAVTGRAARVTAVEIDALHARLARENASDNGVADRLTVIEADVARARVAPADLVIANLPYFDPAAGPSAADARNARARALDGKTLDSFVRASRRALGRDGRVVMGFPSGRVAELFASLAHVGLRAKRLRFVHARPQREAQVVMVEAKPAKSGGLVIEPALFVRGTSGQPYTAEVEDTQHGRWT